ncbi:SusD family protein [Mariniflexile rhizosphaerae]|uniref:RagB/SusD family nutrient uptake outer membrane protein n=1 Tax=unclassified Mariniflexile TaxID=2643887 RepID=UPI000CA82628|nr:RagB/SusD family nutrient uptake outer membrane protein [Mariniflexile sp. TRM1-10]AXP80053.1 SusD family protein [Mariniflexile sp. TRM1-10]PLB20941.1 MAG: RagB/SusD family protein [Flavobacteriaceae bacterium FS1-H7996/R]
MKNIKINSLLALLIMVFLSSCSADFIEEKKDYSSVNVGIYQDEFLANGYLDYLYYMMQPDNNPNMAMWSKAAREHSSPDLFAKSSDEVAGESDLNKEYTEISNVNNHCLKSLGVRLGSSPLNTTWSRIRYCNLYLDNVDDYTGLEQDFKNQVKGQFYFWRAWQYFELVRLYGGVPLVLTAQPANVDDPSVQTPRSSSSEVIEQIVSDLEMSQSLLENARPYTAAEAGRITAAAAAALKGRVLLTWASPLFNRTDDQTRWQRAYDANLEAYNVCIAAGKGLDPDWKGMWFKDNGMESIFSFGFNDFAPNTSGVQRNNYTEYQSRSRDQGGNGGISPTKNIIDAFPMADGTPYNPNGNLNHFYRNRDPRFYHTFAYNGSIWPYAGNANYRNWTYYWYPLASSTTLKVATNTSQNATGIYLRKFTNNTSSNTNGFRNNGDDYMEIRFAEVVLNLAESAVGANKLSEGKGYIKSIRARAGVTNGDGDYGLASVSTRDGLFAACINERKVEFAYENKRFHDLRRWLLFNDDNNTCTRLNQTPIEGSRRQGYYTFAKRNESTLYIGIPDPFKGASAPVISREATTYPSGITSYEQYVDYLYDNHFEVQVRDDVDSANFSFKWYNEYYFFGIYQQLLETAPYLQQTQGWGGSFNPLN